ncbi:MAG TPA: GDSL-type esterase/lipase family protein [Thermoanaerobaculia bacterium]|nr:GDSL-type esterase/lipase family protein [Thermoanaerobaculia bacterium]
MAVTVLLLAAGEGLARVGYEPPPPDEPWMAYSREAGWVRRPGFSGDVHSAVRTFDAQGLFPNDARGLARRPRRLILAVGDSRTFGVGVDVGATWAEQLERRLAGTEVVNLGVPGYSARQGRAALELALERPELSRPDIVIFSFGFNDRRYVLRPEDADGAAAFSRNARRASWAALLRQSALLSRLSRPAATGRVRQGLDLGSVVPRLPAAEFQRELASVARLCAERGIGLVFLWTPDNPAQAGDLRAGIQAARNGDLDVAREALQRVVKADNAFSDAARLELARVYERLGRAGDARAARTSPRLFRSASGGYPILASLSYRAAEQQAARAGHVMVVDASDRLEAEPGVFLDFCHFDARGHAAVAELLAARLQ